VTTIDPFAFKGNPLNIITIGANVDLGYVDTGGVEGAVNRVDVFDNSFDIFYINNGKKAGTYTLNNGVWTFGGLIFHVGYVHDTNMNQLADRSKIKYGDGGETVIIYSNVDLYEFKIFNNETDYLSGDINVSLNVLSTSNYLEYMTNIPEGIPAEAIQFKTADGKTHYYWLGYSGIDGTVVAMRVEG